MEQETNYARVERAIKYLEENFTRQPELDEVAEKVHLSPFHFQKIFSEWAGISPKRFLQFTTVNFLKTRLAATKNLATIAEEAGLSAQSRVYDLFTTLEAVTPQEYKQKGSGLRIQYGFHHTPFGLALIGVTERGVCWLSFVPNDTDPASAVEAMKIHWHHAVFSQQETLTQTYIHKIFADHQQKAPLHLLVKGTNFQVKVWEALLKIPMGHVTTYQSVANLIDHPRAMQAVGSAVGANHIAYLIPCHRVIRKDGVLGEYRWSATRKKCMVGWEMARQVG